LSTNKVMVNKNPLDEFLCYDQSTVKPQIVGYK